MSWFSDIVDWVGGVTGITQTEAEKQRQALLEAERQRLSAEQQELMRRAMARDMQFASNLKLAGGVFVATVLIVGLVKYKRKN